MTPVLDHSELEQSPLADLHAIASELGVEGFRRLRRDDLIAALLAAHGGQAAPAADGDGPAPARRARRSTRSATRRRASRSADRDEEDSESATSTDGPVAEAGQADGDGAEKSHSGVLDILPNGSGFVRAAGLERSPDDAYVSPAQIRKLELRAGDEVSGPARPPRRSERHPSLVRIDSVNGSASDGGAGARSSFDALTPVWATERLASPSELSSVPYGKGSRVAIGGEPGSGASTLLRKMLTTLSERHPELLVAVVLAGVRPEEATDWRRDSGLTVTGGGFDQPAGDLLAAATLAVERGKRAVEKGDDALVAIDSLAHLPPDTVGAIFGAARRAEEGGSLTIIATTAGAEDLRRLATTRIVLDSGSSGRFPGSLVAAASGTTRADLLG